MSRFHDLQPSDQDIIAYYVFYLSTKSMIICSLFFFCFYLFLKYNVQVREENLNYMQFLCIVH